MAPGVVDTDMQVTIRASIGSVRFPAPICHGLSILPPRLYLCTEDADELMGKEVVLLDPEFGAAFG